MTQATAGGSLEPLTESGQASWLRQAATRVRQFALGLRAEVHESELTHASALLPHAAFGLFLLLPVDAQRHSLNVLGTLEQEGSISRDLAAAALLHDVGKLAAEQAGRPITLWVRGPLVLLDAWAPVLARRLASDDPTRGWRYTLYVHAAHAAIGAAWAAEAGCAPRTCWLIEHHQDKQPDLFAEPDALVELRRLQAADALH